jgi:hypothetical protein
MAGIRAGRVYLMADGPDGPELDLDASCGEQQATMGGEAAGTACTITASVKGAFGNNLKVIVDQAAIDQSFISSDDFSREVQIVPAALSVARIEVRSLTGPLRGLSNPVFLRYDDTPEPPDAGTDAGEDAGPFDAGPEPPDGGEGGAAGAGPSLVPPAVEDAGGCGCAVVGRARRLGRAVSVSGLGLLSLAAIALRRRRPRHCSGCSGPFQAQRVVGLPACREREKTASESRGRRKRPCSWASPPRPPSWRSMSHADRFWWC